MSAPHSPLRVGHVLFPGFELLDVYGPLEMLGLLGERATISMLAEEAGAVTSHAGPKAVAEATLAEAGDFDVLLIPGGQGTRREVENTRLLGLLRELSARSRIVATVCTGSALLARTGLLDGVRATSNKLAWDWVIAQGPKVNWVRRARWVEDGKYFTSSGISAGIDMSLALIARELGRETARNIAGRAEYLWNEASENDPFA